MARDDIVFGVDLDLSGFDSKMGLVDGAFRILKQQVTEAIVDFREFEEQAAALGTTMESITGVSRDAAASYRLFNQEAVRLNTTLRSLRIETLAPTVGLLGELANAAANTAAALQDVQQEGGVSGGLRSAAATILSPGLAAGRFFENRLTRDVSDAEAEARGRMFDAQNEMERQRREQARLESQQRLREGLGDIQERFSERRARATGRSLDQRLQAQRGFNQFQQFQGIDQQVFEQSQAIDRRTFQRIQSLQSAAGISNAELERRQRVQQQAFDIRQEATAEKKELRDSAALLKAQERLNRTNERSEEVLREILAELRVEQVNESVDLRAREAEVLEGVNN